MSKQITANPSTRTVSEIYQKIKNGTLILQPDFQRRFVWNSKHKEKFIDTLLEGFLVPEIFVAQTGIDLETIEAEEVVVDGQQRLHTILEYIDESKDSKVFGRIVKKYSELPKEQQRELLNYRFLFRDLGELSSEKIKEVFKRINSTQYSLHSVELHNAIYDGEFISVAKEILDEISVEELPFFSQSQISRMDDLLFVLLILSTIQEGGYFVNDKYVEKYIEACNEEYSEGNEIKEKVIKVFKYIDNLKLSTDSLWMRKSCYFTMFIEVYNVYEKLKDKQQKLKNRLELIEQKIEQNKGKDNKSNVYANFYTFIYSGTNSRKARVERGNFFKNEILDDVLN